MDDMTPDVKVKQLEVRFLTKRGLKMECSWPNVQMYKIGIQLGQTFEVEGSQNDFESWIIKFGRILCLLYFVIFVCNYRYIE